MTNTFDIQTLSTSPRLHIIDGFVSESEVDHVLRVSSDPATLGPDFETHMDSSSFSFEMPVGRDPVLTEIRSRVAAVLGFGNDLDATFRFRRYAPGESHPQHTDAFAHEGSELIVTAMIGLVAPDAGGETLFPLAEGGPIAVPPRRGRLVLWFNHTTDGEVDQQSAHSASRVELGEKTTLTAFVYKPTYYAASPFPAAARKPADRRALLLHGGCTAAVRRAWTNAAEWTGFDACVWDTRDIEPAPDGDVMLPMDLSYSTKRVLTERYRSGWTNVFVNAPEVCSDVSMYLARKGFPMRHDAVARAPFSTAGKRWVAVVHDRCIGPHAPADLRAVAINAVHALRTRTGIVEYEIDSTGAALIVSVSAPAELSRLPCEWWAPFCLATMQSHREALAESDNDGPSDAPNARPRHQLLAEPV